jgi:hypothetical protein
MRITRFRYRVAEALLFPLGIIVIDGLIHLSEGKPFMTEYLWGAAFAVLLLRGQDAMRAANHIWPEA